MATATVTEFATKTISVTVSAAATSSNRATPQGGVFEGLNPSRWNPQNPIILFTIQAAIVILLTRIIHFPLTKLRQPRVIAEVITGIILGPSIMGRIPGFTAAIFPTASMPAFTLAANLGLVLFLFLVGLEVDLRFMASNWRIALSVSAAGMAIPFGLGCAIAVGLYHEFRHDPGLASISFSVYMLFIGVAMAITAFPVLCRILTSLKLLSTPVGVIVLSAGVGNDVVGWILLALCVALVNSGASLTALWILLVAFGYTLFLTYAVRPVFIWILRKTGSLANGPTQTVVALTVLLVLASAFFTGIIGIHPIFGAFMIGLMAPHEGGFAVKLTEKLEDLVSVLFLPLYFALSGLSTNLGLLNNGITWAYVVGVCACAFFGKIAGGTLAARLNGLVWRESFTIGCLMSCKGLVELIVLNIGLQAKILSTRTFTIFVVMALVTTFATTPLTTWLYPPWYQQKLELWKKGVIDWDGNPIPHPHEDSSESGDADALRKHYVASRILTYLRLDGLPSIFTLVSLLGSTRDDQMEVTVANPLGPSHDQKPPVLGNVHALTSVTTLRRPVQVHGLRLVELTERGSSVMKVSEIEAFAAHDPIIKAFGTFGQARDIVLSGQIAVVPEHSFSDTLLSHARELRSDFVLIPWSETGTMSEYPSLWDQKPRDPLANRPFAALVTETFEKARHSCHVGVFIEMTALEGPGTRTNSPITEKPTRQLSRVPDLLESGVQFKLADNRRYRIVVLYQGGEDDLLAVKLALQLARSESVDLRVVRAGTGDETDDEDYKHGPSDDFEFNVMRAGIPESTKQRVDFIDLDSVDREAVLTTLSEPTGGAETVMILGRGVHVGMSTMASTSSRDESQVLGPLAMVALNLIRDHALNVELMVVQAKREARDDNKEVGVVGGTEVGRVVR